jgi:hypothetical protein
VLIVTVVTTGRTKMKSTPAVISMALAKHPVRRMIGMKNKKWNCSKCSHVGQETTDDVACCNCCEDGEFFDSVEEEVEDRYTLDDLGWNWW